MGADEGLRGRMRCVKRYARLDDAPSESNGLGSEPAEHCADWQCQPEHDGRDPDRQRETRTVSDDGPGSETEAYEDQARIEPAWALVDRGPKDVIDEVFQLISLPASRRLKHAQRSWPTRDDDGLRLNRGRRRAVRFNGRRGRRTTLGRRLRLLNIHGPRVGLRPGEVIRRRLSATLNRDSGRPQPQEPSASGCLVSHRPFVVFVRDGNFVPTTNRLAAQALAGRLHVSHRIPRPRLAMHPL